MADNEERLILSADSARLKRGVDQAVKTLQNLSDLTGRTDRELGTLESSAQRAATSLKSLGSSIRSTGGKSPMARWSKDAQEVVTQLHELEKIQRRINDRKVSAIDLPSSLQGRDPNGRFTASDVSNLSDSELQQIASAYENMEMTLSSAVAKETNRRSQLRREELAEAKRLADEAKRAAEAKTSEVGSRGYANASVLNDAAIAKREQEGKTFAAGLRQRMEAEAKAAQVTDEHTAATQRGTGSMITARYALYDLGTTYTAVAAAITVAGIAIIKTTADFESAFTNVERTLDTTGMSAQEVGGTLRELRSDLINLSTSTPTSFEDIAAIATLGNQLGVADDAIVSFTENTQKFALVSGMTVEATATAFGSLGTLLDISADKYANLGSAIALVGRTSVATEAEIVTMSTRLAASAARAGFTAEEVIGLSGALASLRIAPERAQGVMEVYLSNLNSALADGGEKLEIFAAIAGVATEDMQHLVATDPNKFFRDFAAGLGTLDPVTQTQALQELGLAGIRAGEVLGRVAANVDVYDAAIRTSAQGMGEATEMDRQYAMVLDDLNSQLAILGNSFMGLLTAIGGVSGTGLAEFVGQISDAVQWLTQMVDTPVGHWVTVLITLMGGLVLAMTAYAAVTAIATASAFAFRTAQMELGKMNMASGIRGLIQALFGYSGAAAGATGATLTLRSALWGLLRATIILGAIALVIEVLSDLRGAALAVAPVFDFLADVYVNTVNTILDASIALGNVLAGLPGIGGYIQDSIKNMQNMRSNSDVVLKQMKSGFRDFAKSLPSMGDGFDDVGDASGKLGKTLNESTVPELGNLGDALGGAGDSAKDAAEEIRTLVDYANDLQGVFSRSFDLRFGNQTSLDAITKSFSDMRKATADTAEAIRKLRADIQGLRAERGTLQYFLGVAIEYGDTLRAAELQADIAKINADLADKNKDLANEQKKASKTLTGNSDAAIENRGALTGLVQKYQDYLVQLAESGMSQEDLARKSESLRRDFIRQATQLGFNRSEVQRYAKSFDDMTFAIQRVPRNITVSANTNPAQQALNEFVAKAKSTKINLGVGATGGGGLGSSFADLFKRDFERQMGRNPIAIEGYLLQGQQVYRVPGTGLKLFDSGGYTGPGAKMKPAGIVHAGEYVIPKQYVNQRTGLPYASAYSQIAGLGTPPTPHYYSGGHVRDQGGFAFPSTMVVELSAYDRHLLARAGDVQLSIGGEQIARVVAGENVNSFRRGRG